MKESYLTAYTNIPKLQMESVSIYISCYAICSYIAIALSILYSVNGLWLRINITPFYFIKCDITKLYSSNCNFTYWYTIYIAAIKRTRLDLLRIVPGIQINIPNNLFSVEFLSLYRNINTYNHIWSTEYRFRNKVVTCKKRKYKFSKKPFPILSG